MAWWPLLRKGDECVNYNVDPLKVSYELTHTKYNLKQEKSQVFIT